MNLAPGLKKYFLIALSLLTLVVVSLALWAFKLDRDLQTRIEGDWFLPPVEIYSAPSQIRVGQSLSAQQFSIQLLQMGLRERASHQKL